MTTEAIWKDFASQLLGFIKARVHSPENAEDILQDVFIKIHQQSNHLNDKTKLTSWIYQITRNTIIDFYRKKKITSSENIISEISEEVSPLTDFKFIHCLMPFVKELPKKYREALEKTIYGEFSQKEYAKEINLSYSATKSRVQRARKMVKELFVSCCNVKTDSYGNVISSRHDNCNC
ncbi:MAG: RNA polymerase sigma factor SigZ [Crocinitomicaceae bacterium]|nr:RNA polymerase sigma factor SigZ [Crocinitomicaceae bacterium]